MSTGGSPGLRNGAGLLKHGVDKALSKVLGTEVVALPDRARTQDLPRAKVVALPDRALTQDPPRAKVVALPDL